MKFSTLNTESGPIRRLSIANITRTILILASCILALSRPVLCQADTYPAPTDLNMNLKSVQASYAVGAPVNVTITLKSFGTALEIRRGFPGFDYAFRIVDSHGVTINRRSAPLVAEMGRVVAAERISPSKPYCVTFDLRNYFLLDSPGTYQIIAKSPITLRNHSAPYETVKSNSISIVLR